MKKAALLAVSGMFAISVTAGCGGNVIVEPPGGGGSTTDPVTYCEGLCDEAAKYGCLEDPSLECTSACEGVFSQFPDCNKELVALYDCFIDGLATSGCDVSVACDDESFAFGECTSGSISTCGETGCIGGENECSCQGECNGQLLDATCKGDAANGVLCQCSINGQVAGTCTDTSLSCDLFGGCCAEFFPL